MEVFELIIKISKLFLEVFELITKLSDLLFDKKKIPSIVVTFFSYIIVSSLKKIFRYYIFKESQNEDFEYTLTKTIPIR